MKGRINLIVFLACFVALPVQAEELTYRYGHHLFTIESDDYPLWRETAEFWTYYGVEILPPSSLRIDSDHIPPLPEGIVRTTKLVWDTDAIRATLQQEVASIFDTQPGTVTIAMDEEQVVFDGVGLPGRAVNLSESVFLTVQALETGVSDIMLPVDITQPEITVEDESLRSMGIAEVVSVGESDYHGSPGPRRHNIALGLSKFDGHIIPQGGVFSFNTVLGPVNGETGFQKELVIKGDKTLPDYGGGLCQVSTTAYRGAWEYGFPIDKRRNHSYSVRYYFPQGTDATIYPPYTDMRFTNDSPGALLIQTHTEDDRAYFIYYGKADNRTTDVIGPFTWDKKDPPEDKIEHTTELAPGVTRKVGARVPGIKAAWYRVISQPEEESLLEGYYSAYEARPTYTQIGVAEPKVVVTEPEPQKRTVRRRRQPERKSWMNRFKRPERRRR